MNPWFKELKKAYEIQNFKCVSINEEKIKEFAHKLAKQKMELPNWRNELWPEDDKFIQFIGISTSINACYSAPVSSQKFTKHWAKYNKDYSGSNGLNACFMRLLGHNDLIMDPEFLSTISMDTMKFIFSGTSELPLLQRRLNILRSVGKILLEKYDGHFRNLFEQADYKCFDNGNGICERLVRDFPWAYNDMRPINCQLFPFHKKALLVALCYHGRAQDSEILKPLKDAHRLSPIVDYQIPKLFSELGILEYTEALKNWITSRLELPAYSGGETAIRLFTAIAWEKIMKEVNNIKRAQKKKMLTMAELDYLFWLTGHELTTVEHHRTLTTDY
ncbi:hypothetical protein A2331_03270 [Candidatus Falkowbacteria bacterium RIFOXYB2_FULL_34_18]|uniref:Queuosine 5'-phosphate N-glycosylase/hydrolase n=1 Tax=Candidatus Falkowbacteria bacterium RIFOXYD2_FULL_34_120 TaxID=1798007 RepID=A0A1F5TMS9_9BACT|nr:MAG: hypothetical protein A2500_02495 [Candidatus Falkowbacteria bacterium RIFOXYC12_FULL_34_55]OGF28596.1 MAG: hypothetical protein A2331_03270 [Candidatus Falkowbacteria bacterium RIFOXYB2_FULL_34_18]OGF38037.1 MAG: hypothetical protein A2466_06985 [Candidatus Falkowbacteria bacterium RIFOXYC2_FULL_34_220]OGF38286.1 MAG: hypothetical protein A2515_05020 [Candidatus Falkowbacteria bacterium RIFOXYD12_FULL_34_57]OGF40198.1 MAG: hypothetical protein A2531_01215 [Candidatus Falkowbacteria bact